MQKYLEVSMLQKVSGDSKTSIAQGAKKFAPKADFMSFLDTLGKTTNTKKSENNFINSALKSARAQKMPKNISPKSELDANLKAPKNDKNANLAQKTAPKIPQKIDAQTARLAQKILQESAPKITPQEKNEQFMPKKLDSAQGKSPISSLLSKEPARFQKVAQNDATQTPRENVAQNVQNAREISREVGQVQNVQIPQTSHQTAQIAPNPESSAKNEAPQNAPKIVQDIEGAPKNTQDSQNQIAQIAQQNILAQDSTIAQKQDSKPKLGIKNTLKYGAFKAFDALSLLKPSNGKKISDLIKKADELALNLEKVKYSKTIDAPSVKPNSSAQNIAQNLAPLESPVPQNLQTAQIAQNEPQILQNILNEGLNESAPKNQENNIKQDAKQNSALPLKEEGTKQDGAKQDFTQNSQNNDKRAENEAQNRAQNRTENQVQNRQDLAPNRAEIKNEIAQNSESAPQIEQKEQVQPINFRQKRGDEKLQKTNLESASQTPQAAQNDALKTEHLQRSFDAKETLRHFMNSLRQEIANYKPPLSKITLELHPANLGSVEVSITYSGKNIQVALNANQNTLNLFIQNQSDLRAALSQIGYENVTMSFSNGAQMGFSDSNGNWSFKDVERNFAQNAQENDSEMANLEITIVNNYA